MVEWTESEELGRLLEGMELDGILKLHENGRKKSKSTKNKHEEGVTRYNRDRGGEKKDARKAYNGNRRARGQALVVKAKSFAFKSYVRLDGMDIEYNAADENIELIFAGKHAFDALDDRNFVDSLLQGDLENLEIAWVDYERNTFAWIF